MKRLQHTSVADCAAQFWRKGLPGSEMLRYVDHMEVHDVMSGHPGATNVVSDFPRLSQNEMVYGEGLLEKFQRRMVRPDQKNVV